MAYETKVIAGDLLINARYSQIYGPYILRSGFITGDESKVETPEVISGVSGDYYRWVVIDEPNNVAYVPVVDNIRKIDLITGEHTFYNNVSMNDAYGPGVLSSDGSFLYVCTSGLGVVKIQTSDMTLVGNQAPSSGIARGCCIIGSRLLLATTATPFVVEMDLNLVEGTWSGDVGSSSRYIVKSPDELHYAVLSDGGTIRVHRDSDDVRIYNASVTTADPWITWSLDSSSIIANDTNEIKHINVSTTTVTDLSSLIVDAYSLDNTPVGFVKYLTDNRLVILCSTLENGQSWYMYMVDITSLTPTILTEPSFINIARPASLNEFYTYWGEVYRGGTVLVDRTLTGTTLVSGSPVSRTVRAYHKTTGRLIGETVSDAGDGSFTMYVVNPEPLYVVCVGDGAELSEFYDNVIAP